VDLYQRVLVIAHACTTCKFKIHSPKLVNPESDVMVQLRNLAGNQLEGSIAPLFLLANVQYMYVPEISVLF
jgi:hypothetical protein